MKVLGPGARRQRETSALNDGIHPTARAGQHPGTDASLVKFVALARLLVFRLQGCGGLGVGQSFTLALPPVARLKILLALLRFNFLFLLSLAKRLLRLLDTCLLALQFRPKLLDRNIFLR